MEYSQYSVPKCEFLMAVIGREGKDFLVVGSRKIDFLRLELKRDWGYTELSFGESYLPMQSHIELEGSLQTMVYIKAKSIKKGYKELRRIFAEEEAAELEAAEAKRLEIEELKERSRLREIYRDYDDDWYNYAEEY